MFSSDTWQAERTGRCPERQ